MEVEHLDLKRRFKAKIKDLKRRFKAKVEYLEHSDLSPGNTMMSTTWKSTLDGIMDFGGFIMCPLHDDNDDSCGDAHGINGFWNRPGLTKSSRG